jgi:hypothetical protein
LRTTLDAAFHRLDYRIRDVDLGFNDLEGMIKALEPRFMALIFSPRSMNRSSIALIKCAWSMNSAFIVFDQRQRVVVFVFIEESV